MNLKQIFLYILLLLANSCSNNPVILPSAVTIQDSLIVININCLRKGAMIPFDSLFTGYEYIINQEGDYFQTSGWEICKFDGKENFVGINIPNSTVNLYDSLGNFIRNIGKKGKLSNNGEFEEIYDCCTNPVKKVIYILANKQGKIFKYDYKDNFLDAAAILTAPVGKNTDKNNFRGDALCDVIANTPDNNLLVHYAYWDGNLDYNYCLINDNNEIIATKKTMGQFNGKTRYVRESKSYVYNNYLHTIDLSDTVYAIKGKRFIPKYVFEQKYSLRKIVDSLGPNANIYMIDKPVYQIGNIQETDQYLFFSYIPANRKYQGVLDSLTYAYYNKHTKEAFKLFPIKKMCKYTSDSIPASVLLGPNYGKVTFAKNKQGRIKLHLK